MTDRVLVTGISGFIAKHVALELLRRGYHVRGTVRNLSRADQVTDSLKRVGAPVANLDFCVADLNSDMGWTDAVNDCRYVQHIAAPFPLIQPKEREALVPAAKGGALRVLKAATAIGVDRVVMTSSIVAMMYRARRQRSFTISPADWTDPEWNSATPYIIAKTRAELAAWAFMDSVGKRDQLVAINPGLVLGPPLDHEFGTSLEVVSLLLRGSYPAVPPVAFPITDVRDLAALHVEAMTAGVGGMRLVAAGDTLSMSDMGKLLRAAYPEIAKKIPVTELPIPVVEFLSLFDAALRTLKCDLGKRPTALSRDTTRLTGIGFRPAKESVLDTSRALLDIGPSPRA